jgi:hypothetical protein
VYTTPKLPEFVADDFSIIAHSCVLGEFDPAVSKLQEFIASQEDTAAWRGFGLLKIEERYDKLESSWNSALATTSLLRVRKLLKVLRDSHDGKSLSDYNMI